MKEKFKVYLDNIKLKIYQLSVYLTLKQKGPTLKKMDANKRVQLAQKMWKPESKMND